ncbi:MAG TPA: glycerophosphodiester phosphodiesterase family protein [Gemmataceae bacterium]|nr:glycerophosphodiester phosphodiesterase family protein [Gemmataceae bacterium]
MAKPFELQGHRGARGLKPENTLPSFEVALDAGVTSIETDVHLTRDGVPVLFHDGAISARICRRPRGSTSPDPATEPLISSLTLAEVRGYRANRNPDRRRFPNQDLCITPVARNFARMFGRDPYAPPTLDELFGFAEFYVGTGDILGKTAAQRASARRVVFDLELKRVPYHPEIIGDDFDGTAPGLLELRVEGRAAALGKSRRMRVRSFDHRALRALKVIDPEISTAILIAGTAPVDPGGLAKSAGADVYCPDYRFLDAVQVRQCHAAGVRVLPWTVNEEADWQRLLDWGVDGITTDYPDRLAELLRSRGMEF